MSAPVVTGLRKVGMGSHPNGRSFKLYRDAEWHEFRVLFYRDGVYQEGADHHTPDREDAENTANAFLVKP